MAAYFGVEIGNEFFIPLFDISDKGILAEFHLSKQNNGDL